MIVAAVVVALGVGSVVAVAFKVRRDREWAHGGDALTAQIQLRLADAQSLPAAAVALGYPADEPVLLPSEFPQSVVVRVQWRGPAHRGGSYQLIVLDKRLTPPRPLPVYGGWNANGGTGSNWAGAYEKLAEQYDWLAGTASVQDATGGWTSVGQAVDAPATDPGALTAIFLVPPGDPPVTDTAAHLLVSLFYVDDSGEVRWARRVAG